MCLTAEFFEHQSEAKKKYEEQGYTDLDTLMYDGKVTLKALMKAGFIQKKMIWNTAEVREWEVSAAGKKYLKEYKRPQLIMVKPGKVDELLREIKSKAKMPLFSIALYLMYFACNMLFQYYGKCF